jgi:hypothetical protein
MAGNPWDVIGDKSTASMDLRALDLHIAVLGRVRIG